MLEFIRGLVRPLVTLMGWGAVTLAFLLDKVSAELYLPMVATFLAWWFATRRPGNNGTPPS